VCERLQVQNERLEVRNADVYLCSYVHANEPQELCSLACA